MGKFVKFFFYFFCVGIALALFPLTIGGLLSWLVLKKITNSKIKYSFLAVIAIITLFFGSAWVLALSSPSKQSTIAPKPTPTIIVNPSSTPIDIPGKEIFKVTKVIDGDTINVSINGRNETIRLIGIDSPETVDPRKSIQCFGKEASDKAKEVLTGRSISLEADPTQGELDKYDRLLRFVFLEDGTNFNKLMISEGYAHEYTYQSNPYKYQEEFRNAEKAARKNKKGLWADDVCATPTPTPIKQTTTIAPTQIQSAPVVQTTQSSSTTTGGGSYTCNCSKTCTQISSCDEAYFQLNNCGCKARDADGDGVPCESLCR